MSGSPSNFNVIPAFDISDSSAIISTSVYCSMYFWGVFCQGLFSYPTLSQLVFMFSPEGNYEDLMAAALEPGGTKPKPTQSSSKSQSKSSGADEAPASSIARHWDS